MGSVVSWALLAGCSRREADSRGSIALGLKLSTGAEIATVSYRISGNGLIPLTGTIDVSVFSMATTVVSAIPAGKGYLAELSAVSSDTKTTCAGQATFDIVAGQTAEAKVGLQCHGPGDGNGGVSVTGTFDNCPMLTSYMTDRTSAPVGGTVKLRAYGYDPDGDPKTFAWSQSVTVGELNEFAPLGTVSVYDCLNISKCPQGARSEEMGPGKVDACMKQQVQRVGNPHFGIAEGDNL